MLRDWAAFPRGLVLPERGAKGAQKAITAFLEAVRPLSFAAVLFDRAKHWEEGLDVEAVKMWCSCIRDEAMRLPIHVILSGILAVGSAWLCRGRFGTAVPCPICRRGRDSLRHLAECEQLAQAAGAHLQLPARGHILGFLGLREPNLFFLGRVLRHLDAARHLHNFARHKRQQVEGEVACEVYRRWLLAVAVKAGHE